MWAAQAAAAEASRGLEAGIASSRPRRALHRDEGPVNTILEAVERCLRRRGVVVLLNMAQHGMLGAAMLTPVAEVLTSSVNGGVHLGQSLSTSGTTAPGLTSRAPARKSSRRTSVE